MTSQIWLLLSLLSQAVACPCRTQELQHPHGGPREQCVRCSGMCMMQRVLSTCKQTWKAWRACAQTACQAWVLILNDLLCCDMAINSMTSLYKRQDQLLAKSCFLHDAILTCICRRRISHQGHVAMPLLDLSKLKTSSSNNSIFSKNLTPRESDKTETDAQLCFESSVSRPVHKDAPLMDNRCYIYRAVTTQVWQEHDVPTMHAAIVD